MSTPSVTQQLANYVQTTLASGCTAAATTISVASAAGLPTSGNFMLRIDDSSPATTYEYVECTGVSGTTLTVTRGQEGTTGIAHNAGAFVGNDITSAMLLRAFPWGWLGEALTSGTDQALSGGTLTDITGASVTVTVGAGRRVKVSAFLNFTSTVANDGQFVLDIVDVTAATQVGQLIVNGPNVANAPLTIQGETATLQPGAGTRTYKLQAQRANGTGTYTVKNSNAAGRILVEDIGEA